MFKLSGCVFIMISAYYFFNTGTFTHYFTYKFLDKITTVIKKLMYEKNTGLPYREIFLKIDFEWCNYYKKIKQNRYVKDNEIETVNEFFTGLGKRDALSEEKYIEYYRDVFLSKKDEYLNKYKETKKAGSVCGIALGLFIIIVML